MKLKNLTDVRWGEIAGWIDNEGFWYGFSQYGLNPEDLLVDKKDIDKVNEAIQVLKEFESICPSL